MRISPLPVDRASESVSCRTCVNGVDCRAPPLLVVMVIPLVTEVMSPVVVVTALVDMATEVVGMVVTAMGSLNVDAPLGGWWGRKSAESAEEMDGSEFPLVMV